MNSRDGKEKLDTTLGELIEAVTQIARETADDEQDAYRVVSVALGHILHRHSIRWPSNTL